MPAKSKIEWVEVARRGKTHALLFIDTFVELLRSGYFARAHKVRWNLKCYRQFDNARWYSRPDIEKYQSILEKATNDKNDALFKLVQEYQRRVIKFRRLADKFSRAYFSSLSNRRLAKIFADWFESSKRMWCFGYDYIIINRFLPDIVTSVVASQVPDLGQQNEILGILFAADESSELRLEKKGLVKIAVFLHHKNLKISSPQIKKLLIKHLAKFAHLGFYYFRGAAYAERDLVNRLKEYTRLSKPQFKKMLADFRKQERNQKLTNNLIKKLKLDKKTIAYIRYIKRWGAAASHVDEAYSYSVHRLTPLWREICKRLGIKFSQFYSLQASEIINGLRTGKLSAKLKRQASLRHKDHALILENGRKRILIGKKLAQYYKAERQQAEKIKNVNELKGQSASPGLATGKVKIIFSVHDVAKVERGDILVASATNPTFVPAMERAGAIVTDEGGLLSHAAIVSRELKIPCVVGAKIATRVLRDGDLVEVDANKGEVKKI